MSIESTRFQDVSIQMPALGRSLQNPAKPEQREAGATLVQQPTEGIDELIAFRSATTEG
jgi:hypothetical protein